MMMSNNLLRNAAPFMRQFTTTATRRAHDTSGIVGSNLPFSIENRYKLALGFILYFGSGLALPFVVVRRNLLKKSG